MTHKLKELRLAAGLTQAQLAAKVGISTRQYQKFELGENRLENVCAKNLLALADALEIDPHELLK